VNKYLNDTRNFQQYDEENGGDMNCDVYQDDNNNDDMEMEEEEEDNGPDEDGWTVVK
jgi:hypothetical protein